MKIMIAGGTGFVGRHLVVRLLQRNDDITIIGRERNKIIKIYGDSVKSLQWSELNRKELSHHDAIINLSGQNISEKRWGNEFKKKILESRTDTTSTLALLCSELNSSSPRILNASAVSIYGNTGCCSQQPIPVDESWNIKVNYISDFLNKVAWEWERSLDVAVKKGVSVTIMRFGIVLKIEEGMLKKMALPVKLGLAGKLGSGQQWLSWIHIDDLISAIIFLLDHPEITGPVNLTHPAPITQSDFIHQLAKYYHRPCFFNIPAWLICWLLGEMGEALLLNGQSVFPSRLLKAGFVFSKKTVSEAFA